MFADTIYYVHCAAADAKALVLASPAELSRLGVRVMGQQGVPGD